MSQNIDTDQLSNWRSIVTLIIFVITNIIVLLPFHVPIYLPRSLWNGILSALISLRIISPKLEDSPHRPIDKDPSIGYFVRFRFPLNFVTAPLIADLFLLAILAIGRQEVHDGTLGSDNISPIDILAFFLTLAYIAISIDASGLIRYLAFKVLQWGGKVGHRLFFYLYAFFFGLGSFIGNDPIILSGTAFLAYMTRVSSNIKHPRAWIHSQFAVANIASAILVSSNPTNLVLAGAFDIKFIHYTANMIVPVVVTAIVLFPFLLYIVFASESLIPLSIEMHELSAEARSKRPVNPNIPHARGEIEEQEDDSNNDGKSKLLSLEEIMNPFVDKGGAAFGATIMTATLITILALNAASQSSGEHPVFWVTLPAAFVMFCWDVTFGWYHRQETRDIARRGREEVEKARQERAARKDEIKQVNVEKKTEDDEAAYEFAMSRTKSSEIRLRSQTGANNNDDYLAKAEDDIKVSGGLYNNSTNPSPPPSSIPEPHESQDQQEQTDSTSSGEKDIEKISAHGMPLRQSHGQRTLTSLVADAYRWLQETFPTATAVVAHLPVALVPFAFSMFVLVQALVTKGWVQVFAHGWDHWVNKTGTIGAIGGMGFLSVVLCNFAGTNIGTTILLSRVIQGWMNIHRSNGIPISDRTFWGTVYSMALGVNYGAFSAAFSASLAGLLWRDILARKHIHVRRLEFARENTPIIAIAMTIGCVVLVGEVYIFRDNKPHDLS